MSCQYFDPLAFFFVLSLNQIFGHSPIVIFLAVDVAIPGEARDFAVESVSTLAALEAGGVPSPVDRLKIEAIGDPQAAAGADGRLVRGRRRRRARRLDRL